MPIIMRSDIPMTDPPEGVEVLPVEPNPVLTSDTFSAPDGPIGTRMSDALLGGAPMQWGPSGTGFVVTQGSLTRTETGGTGFVGFLIDTPDVEMRMRVDALPVGGGLWMDLRRAGTVQAAAPAGYRLLIEPSGQLILQYRLATGGNVEITRPGTLAAGTDLTFRASQKRLQVLAGSTVLADVVNGSIPATPGNYIAGLTYLAATTGMKISQFRLRAITAPGLL